MRIMYSNSITSVSLMLRLGKESPTLYQLETNDTEDEIENVFVDGTNIEIKRRKRRVLKLLVFINEIGTFGN